MRHILCHSNGETGVVSLGISVNGHGMAANMMHCIADPIGENVVECSRAMREAGTERSDPHDRLHEQLHIDSVADTTHQSDQCSRAEHCVDAGTE